MMNRSRKSFWENLNRITGLIELIITCHPQGFSLLLGDADLPTTREIHAMMNTGRSKLPEDFKPTMLNLETESERLVYDREYFDSLIELAGGWPHIHLVAKEFRDAESRMWNVVMDHVKFVGNASTRYMSKLGYLAARYSLAPRTITKYRKEFSKKFADMLLMPTGEGDDFYLLPG